jgi:hypothetical protein
LARAPAGATGCLVHHLGDTLRVSTCDNPPAGHAAAVERTGGVGVRLGAARLAGPRPTRPDTTTRRRRWKGHFGVATSRRQSAARRHTAILMREHGIGRICTPSERLSTLVASALKFHGPSTARPPAQRRGATTSW